MSGKSELRVLVEEHKKARSHRDRADIEAHLWELFPKKEKRNWRRREWLRSVLGGHAGQYEMRQAIRDAPALLWDRVEAGSIALQRAGLVWKEARRLMVKGATPVEAIQEVLKDPVPTAAAPRSSSRQREAASTKSEWTQIRAIVKRVVEDTAGDLHPRERDGLFVLLDLEIKGLVHEFRNRVGSERRSSISAESEITRKELRKACVVMRLSPPRWGRPVEGLKRQKKRLVQVYHPDKGVGADRGMFESIMAANQLLEKYNAECARRQENEKRIEVEAAANAAD